MEAQEAKTYRERRVGDKFGRNQGTLSLESLSREFVFYSENNREMGKGTVGF